MTIEHLHSLQGILYGEPKPVAFLEPQHAGLVKGTPWCRCELLHLHKWKSPRMIQHSPWLIGQILQCATYIVHVFVVALDLLRLDNTDAVVILVLRVILDLVAVAYNQLGACREFRHQAARTTVNHVWVRSGP